MNRLIIIGASGHGKVVADIVALYGYKDNIIGGCTIGAGAVVIKDIDIKEIYVGVPVKMVSNKKLTGVLLHLDKPKRINCYVPFCVDIQIAA